MPSLGSRSWHLLHIWCYSCLTKWTKTTWTFLPEGGNALIGTRAVPQTISFGLRLNAPSTSRFLWVPPLTFLTDTFLDRQSGCVTHLIHQNVCHHWRNVKFWGWLWHGDGDAMCKQTFTVRYVNETADSKRKVAANKVHNSTGNVN